MKAITIDGYGRENTKLREVADPEPGPGEVLVRVRAAALNHLDLWTLSGELGIKHEFQHVLGADGAGEVEALGEGVKGPQARERRDAQPCSLLPGLRALPQRRAVRMPPLPHARRARPRDLCREGGCARNQCLSVSPGPVLRRRGGPGRDLHHGLPHALHACAYEAGEWVLITGIGGGLAQSLFQLALPLAGRLFVTSSSKEKIDRAIELGAAGGVDYTSEEVGRSVRGLTAKRGVDLALDSAGGESLPEALKALRKGGRLVIAGATAGAEATIDLRRVFGTSSRSSARRWARTATSPTCSDSLRGRGCGP